jgi:hypothetical protein
MAARRVAVIDANNNYSRLEGQEISLNCYIYQAVGWPPNENAALPHGARR